MSKLSILIDKILGRKPKINTETDVSESKHFCIIPWIHTHVLPNGDVIPCCVSEFTDVYGNVNKTPLKKVWNNAKYKTMRRLMMSDRAVYSCAKCYELEDSGISSMRKRMNSQFKHHVNYVTKTENDGFLEDPQMKYLDIRFSNICNFKCRGCSPALSTKWYEDHQKLWDFKSSDPKLINAAETSPTLWDELEELLPSVEIAYFAGGEPLLMDEHYQCLDFMIKHGKTDVALRYNTNMSILKFKNYDILDLWKNFKKITLGISLDDIETRGEYFRSGLKWDNFLNNLKIIKKEIPHALIQVNCTIQIFNIHRIPNIHQCLFELGIIDEFGFNFNTLQDPVEYRTQVLPEHMKIKTKQKLDTYVQYLKKVHSNKNWDHFISNLGHQIHFMLASDLQYHQPRFVEMTKKLDEIRKENFVDIYPELAELFE